MGELIYRTCKTPTSALIKEFEYSYGIVKGERWSEKLRVKFVDGRDWEYSTILLVDIPNFSMEKLYTDMSNAESVGKFWHKYIKGKMQYNRVNGSK